MPCPFYVTWCGAALIYAHDGLDGLSMMLVDEVGNRRVRFRSRLFLSRLRDRPRVPYTDGDAGGWC